MVQDVCPGRRVPEPQHAMMLGDAVALQLALDALEHRGPASAARLWRVVCWQGSYAGFDPDDLRSHEDHTAELAAKTMTEPALFCRDLRSCRDPELRGRAISATRYTIGWDRITIRTRVKLPGRIKVVGGTRVIAQVGPSRQGRAAGAPSDRTGPDQGADPAPVLQRLGRRGDEVDPGSVLTD